MQKQFDGFEHPNHTQVPNDFFDRLLPMIENESELRVTLVAIRQTIGYHKTQVELTLSFLMKGAGMSRNAARAGLASAIKRGTMTIVKKATVRDGAIYGLRWDKNEGYRQGMPRGTAEACLEVPPGYPIKKGKKYKETVPAVSAEIHPAIKVFREVRRSYPRKELYPMIENIVGATDFNLELWRKILVEWTAKGYNPMNIDGALECFKRGSIGKPNGNGRGKESASEQLQRVLAEAKSGKQGTDSRDDEHVIDCISFTVSQ